MTTINPSQFIQAHNSGILSTLSASEPGYPFGSVIPYIVTKKGGIAIFISHLAEHTNNIEENDKVSLTIFDPINEKDPSAGSRITCLANAKKSIDEIALREAYLKTFPQAAIILALPGFHFYTLTLTKIRLVAGFGQVKWLNAKQLSL